MKFEWKECALQEIINFKNGKKKPSEKGNIPVYGGNGVLGYVNQFNLKKGIAIGRVGAYCGSVYYSDKECWISDNAIQAINNANSDILFDYYLLNSLKLNERKIGTSQPLLTQEILNHIEIKCPPLQTQKKIASILSTLDDKIALNTAINENLEQQAQAIFKSWFVDFDPFGGIMPDTITKTPLIDLCSVITKGTTPTTLGKTFTEKGINFIKAESILDNHSFDIGKFTHIDEETNNILKRSIIQAGDIVFTIAGTLGRFAIVDENIIPANTNQAVAIIRVNKEIISPEYLYSFFIGNWHNDYYKKRVQQAVQANLSLTTIKSLPIIILNKENINRYTKIITPIFKKMKINEIENNHLSTLRDTLLPKLMNGEIDVFSVEI